MHWRLRRATTADAPRLSLVAAATFLQTFANLLPGDDIVAHVATKSSRECFAAWAADPDSVVTLAEHPNTAAPVGYTVMTRPEDVGDTGADGVELRRIYTLDLARGTGLGAALMARAVADARSLGFGRIVLGVLGVNTRACAFYERQGFAITGERRFLVGRTWHDDLVYARAV